MNRSKKPKLDGLVLAHVSTGYIWRVHEPPRWRLDRWVAWLARKFTAGLLLILGRRLPAWCQVGTLVLNWEGKSRAVRVVRDAKVPVTWVPDGVPMPGPWELQ